MKFTYQEFSTTTFTIRAALGINLINLLPDLLINTTLVWEPAALFYDLLQSVFSSLIPLVVFLFYFGMTFTCLFYTIGMHQLTFDFRSNENRDDIESGIIREHLTGDDPEDER